jgi:hypothetical protein
MNATIGEFGEEFSRMTLEVPDPASGLLDRLLHRRYPRELDRVIRRDELPKWINNHVMTLGEIAQPILDCSPAFESFTRASRMRLTPSRVASTPNGIANTSKRVLTREVQYV